jgi:hypothetical protein
MVRIVLPSSVRALTAFAIVVLALSTPAGAQELGQLYDLNETVSVEADVRNFIWGEATPIIVIAPLDKTKAGPNGMIVVAWHPTTPLSQQGIPMYWLKPNERVVVTGHPRRPSRPGTKPDGSLLLKTITRPSDGWKWPVDPPSSANPAAQPSSSSASGAVATVSKPNAVTPTAKDSLTTSALPRFAGTWVYVKRSGRDSDAYLPGHLSELGVLTISEAADVLTLHKNPQEISTYPIDGREHPIVWTRDNVSTRSMVTAMREANRLVLDIKLTFPDGSRTITAKRVFSLTPDGGLLVETTGALVGIDGSKTDRSGTWLYKRAEAENRDSPAAPASAPPAQPPAAVAAPTAPKSSNPQQTDSRGAAQAQIDKQVAAGTTTVTDELRKKSQQALEQARVETLCTQRAYKVSTDPANAAHQQALAACRAENGQPGAGGAATAATQVPAVDGTYVGTYQCAQGATRLKVEVERRNPPLLTARFTFYPASRIPGTNSDSFSYQLEGRYEPSADTRLTPMKWTSTPPPGYAMVGMVGRFEPQAGAFNGRIEGAGCSTFALSRNPIKVAEFTFAVNNAAAQPPTQRPASPEPATVPPAGNTRPTTPATPSTAARTTTAAPSKTLEFESGDVDALSKAVQGGARDVTVRGTITRITDMEMGAALKDPPALYFEGERVLVGPIFHSLSVQLEAKFGKNGLVGKRVAVTSYGGSVRPDGRVLLMVQSADNVRVESR